MRLANLLLVAALINASCGALSTNHGDDQMTTSAFVSPDQARPLSTNHNTAMGDSRYLRVETIDEDEERGLSFLNTLTKELMDDILKTKEAQRNFFCVFGGLAY
ncbi:hypothetical protein L915_01397 [Phytophthora nicotianae]|uniref:RxLR effector protein n=1 Tax=Phytophthora nicotianae TaxID=4792 RepID=W2HMI4_PHYNI|nr:hypothetical protein L915_01397 [Phytophthora nicotianae]